MFSFICFFFFYFFSILCIMKSRSLHSSGRARRSWCWLMGADVTPRLPTSPLLGMEYLFSTTPQRMFPFLSLLMLGKLQTMVLSNFKIFEMTLRVSSLLTGEELHGCIDSLVFQGLIVFFL